MGQKNSRTPTQPITSKQNPFKLFEYQCCHCKSKRPIQYFYKNGVFLPQAPRVVCGGCSCSVVVDPFKTVDYSCPSCKKWQKVRLPAKPVPLNMYNVSKVSCNCGFRGEVTVGRHMDVACSQCWTHKRELRDVWTEDGDEIKTYCTPCEDYQRAFARAPQKKGAAEQAEMEYKCDGCARVRPIGAEELLRNQGLACCDLCNWVGYPEVTERGCKKSKAKMSSTRSQSSHSVSSSVTRPKRATPTVAAPSTGYPKPHALEHGGEAWATTAAVATHGSDRPPASFLVVPIAAEDL